MSPRMLSLHHFIKSAILFGFAIYIVYLVKTDNILFYIAPRMIDYVKWSALGLYAIAVYQVYLGIRSLWGTAVECDCDHDHTPSSSLLKNIALYGLFVIPLLFGFLLPDTSMGSSLAAKKGMNLSSSSNVKKEPSGTGATAAPASPAPEPSGGSSGSSSSSPKSAAAAATNLDDMFPADKFTEHYAKYAKQIYKSDIIRVKEELFLETLTTVDLYMDRFVGKKLELTGFVYRQEEMKDNQFVVGRFSIQCCSADAAPFGVLVEYDRASTFADDSWVTVTGTIQKTNYNGMDIMMLKVEKIAKAEPSKSQYVYPNFDFGT
ncbi:TIGR03943 family putative permease subunit [Paenibacillus sp. UNC451MF]|uniref:TIGR03943 family putative permease subunit n=1 Tax=Paenibacillus sp. UNC451MF TaxID=1449063 RepID=UPI00048F4CF5|nr:TIGR03943 family protein [Paenibacillus sp. UNC451MF]